MRMYAVEINIGGEWEELVDFPTLKEAEEQVTSYQKDDELNTVTYDYKISEVEIW